MEGDLLVLFNPLGAELQNSSPGLIKWRNQHPVLSFDDAVTEYACWQSIMPGRYSGRDVYLNFHYCTETAEAGRVRWGMQFERIAERFQDIDGDGFAAAFTTISAVPGTCGLVRICGRKIVAGADMDNIVVGDSFRLKVYRDVADDVADDVQLLFVEMREF